ncbi:MAG: carbamoyl phosphate synthase small subunit, partial [Treponema sp.]|nr:carbamoyl phosphate synthase small subunit [Treponema sp.]
MSKAFLILEDSTIFEGHSIGVKGQTIGEVVFTTGMTGYVETLTDPSYYGQIVTQTFPLIGNYGVMPKDFESTKSWVRGYIVRELCDHPSNFRCEESLDAFLKAQNIVGICGIDTRALTKKLRESGVMNGMIVSDEGTASQEILQKIKAFKIENALKAVQVNITSAVPEPVEGGVGAHKNVVLFDFGAKANIKRELEKRGCKVTVVPYNTTAEEVLKMSPDGIMLSNGPGDPAENVGVIEEIRKLCEWGKTPIFGICLGHQMLALARGAKTSKLKYGH